MVAEQEHVARFILGLKSCNRAELSHVGHGGKTALQLAIDGEHVRLFLMLATKIGSGFNQRVNCKI